MSGGSGATESIKPFAECSRPSPIPVRRSNLNSYPWVTVRALIVVWVIEVARQMSGPPWLPSAWKMSPTFTLRSALSRGVSSDTCLPICVVMRVSIGAREQRISNLRLHKRHFDRSRNGVRVWTCSSDGSLSTPNSFTAQERQKNRRPMMYIPVFPERRAEVPHSEHVLSPQAAGVTSGVEPDSRG